MRIDIEGLPGPLTGILARTLLSSPSTINAGHVLFFDFLPPLVTVLRFISVDHQGRSEHVDRDSFPRLRQELNGATFIDPAIGWSMQDRSKSLRDADPNAPRVKAVSSLNGVSS
jgi:hypothetical protein